MAKTKRCPACRAEVDADEQHCPNCPHSFFQDEGVQEERKGRSKEPVLWFVGGILFFFAAWRVLNFVIKYADADSEKDVPFAATADRHASTTTAAGAAQSGLSPEQQAEKQAEQQVRTALASGRVKVVTEEGVPLAQPAEDAGSGDDQATVLTVPGAGSGQAPPKEWRLRGRVYDLVTLKPLSHATVVFKDAELDRHFELETGADGRYRTVIPSLTGRGYAVSVSHPDYTVSYLDPRTDVRGKTRKERVQMAQELNHGMDEPYSVEALGRAPVETDFYLAPLDPK